MHRYWIDLIEMWATLWDDTHSTYKNVEKVTFCKSTVWKNRFTNPPKTKYKCNNNKCFVHIMPKIYFNCPCDIRKVLAS